jgi:hypothetical protein
MYRKKAVDIIVLPVEAVEAQKLVCFEVNSH